MNTDLPSISIAATPYSEPEYMQEIQHIHVNARIDDLLCNTTRVEFTEENCGMADFAVLTASGVAATTWSKQRRPTDDGPVISKRRKTHHMWRLDEEENRQQTTLHDDDDNEISASTNIK